MTSLHDHRFPDITFADIRAELDRADAASDIAGAVAKGAITRADADRHQAIVAALCQDVARFAAAYADFGLGRPLQRPAPAAHAIPWHDRRAFLLDELQRRQRTYPALIAKGRLTPASAARQFDRLAALLARYEDGLDFPYTPADFAAPVTEMHDEMIAGTRRNWRLHLDIAPAAESSTQSAPVSGRAMVAKGPNDDRSRQPARTLF